MTVESDVTAADVVVVGAGPSGTATAVHLGQLGVRRTILVDRAEFPRDKTCGSGISPKGIQYLRRLGVWEQLESRAYPIKGLRVVTPGDRSMLLSGKDTAAVICYRRTLDDLLVRRAQALGVRFVQRFCVSELIEQDGRVSGVRAADGREIRARYTVVADGAHSRLISDREPRQVLQTIMGWWERVPFNPHHVEMVFDPLVLPHYGWLFPESPGRVNIGICYRDEDRTHNARQLFHYFLSKHYASRLRDAVQVGDWKGHPILYSYSIDKLHSPGRLVVGEAGRLTHPATGEGIYQGIRSGMMAAEALHAVLRGEQAEYQAFARYQARCRHAFLYSFWSAKIFQRLLDSPVPNWIARIDKQPVLRHIIGRLMARM